MKRTRCSLASLVIAAAVLCAPSFAAQNSRAAASKPGDSSRMARGRYLVEEVAICAECHTPANERGEPDRTRWLQGATINFQPVRPNPNWALSSPDIAGLPGWSDAEAVRFFMTGIDRRGTRARPPMHQYRFSNDDAEAVVAYLKSLSPGKQ